MDDELVDGEVRFRTALRGGGWAGVTDDAFVLSHPNESPERVAFADITGVEHQPLNRLLVVLSLGLVLLGALALTRSQFLVGGVFVIGGLASLAFTYGRRDQVGIRTSARATPLKFYPADFEGLLGALDDETGE